MVQPIQKNEKNSSINAATSSTIAVEVYNRVFVVRLEQHPGEEFWVERTADNAFAVKVRVTDGGPKYVLDHVWARVSLDERGAGIVWITAANYHDSIFEAILWLRQRCDAWLRSEMQTPA